MTSKITIEIDNKELRIMEENCEQKTYAISEDLPAMIDEICERLHDYLEGM